MKKEEYDANPKICLECGNPILRKPQEMPTRMINRKYCSLKCASIVANRIKSEKQKEEFFCSICGTSMGFGNKKEQKRKLCDNCNPNIIDWSTITYREAKEQRKYQYNSRIRQIARKIYLASDKPKQCINCGYKKHFEVCHIKAISSYSEETTIAEINSLDNLIALCPNCHWEFDNDIHNQKISFQIKKNCIDCGKEINISAERCESCAHLAKRIVIRPSRDNLKQLVREKTFVEIGKMYNVTDNCIRKWCNTENIPSRKKDIRLLTDNEWEQI